MKYKAYLFDLDGTLLNSLDDLAQAVNYALCTHNLPMRSLTEIKKILGNGVKKLIADAVPPKTDEGCYDKVLKTFRSYYINHCMDNTVPYDGVLNVLRDLKEKGAKLCIISNKPDNAVQELYRRFFSEYMDYAVGESEDVRRKPWPDGILKAMNQVKVSPKDAVYIGDSEVDIETAQRAQIDCISVTWGFRDKDFLEAVGATKMIGTPLELLKI